MKVFWGLQLFCKSIDGSWGQKVWKPLLNFNSLPYSVGKRERGDGLVRCPRALSKLRSLVRNSAQNRILPGASPNQSQRPRDGLPTVHSVPLASPASSVIKRFWFFMCCPTMEIIVFLRAKSDLEIPNYLHSFAHLTSSIIKMHNCPPSSNVSTEWSDLARMLSIWLENQ